MRLDVRCSDGRVDLERGSAMARRSAVPARGGGRLPDPARQLVLVDRIRLAHVQPAHVPGLADRWHGLERGWLPAAAPGWRCRPARRRPRRTWAATRACEPFGAGFGCARGTGRLPFCRGGFLARRRYGLGRRRGMHDGTGGIRRHFRIERMSAVAVPAATRSPRAYISAARKPTSRPRFTRPLAHDGGAHRWRF